ncbi:unnamed protein product [Sphacelaria rigidula]
MQPVCRLTLPYTSICDRFQAHIPSRYAHLNLHIRDIISRFRILSRPTVLNPEQDIPVTRGAAFCWVSSRLRRVESLITGLHLCFGRSSSLIKWCPTAVCFRVFFEVERGRGVTQGEKCTD